MRRQVEARAGAACCVLCGAGSGLVRRSLATLRAACLQLHGIESEPEWVCRYCWVRAGHCIRFIECVRSGAQALDGAHIGTQKKTFPAYSVQHHGPLNICDQNECQTEQHHHAVVPPQPTSIPRSMPVPKLVVRTDLNEIKNLKCVLKKENNCEATTEVKDRYWFGEHSEDTNDCASKPFQYDGEPKKEPESPEPDIKPTFYDLMITVEESMSTAVKNDTVVEIPELTVSQSEAIIQEPRSVEKKKATLLESRSEVTKTQEAEQPQEYLIDVVYLSKEEQLQELAERKMSVKYLGAKYRCDMCGYATDDEVAYGYHGIKHSELFGPHACEVCGFRHQSASSLGVHATLHARRWRCRRCGQSMRYKWMCKPHYEKCARVGGVPCPECGKLFSTSLSMRMHLNKQHRMAKRYECDQCGYKVKHRYLLTAHMRVHSDVSDFKCDLCGKRLKSIQSLKAHIKNHEPNVTKKSDDNYCVECNHVFKDKYTLQIHLKTSLRHVAKDTYKIVCSECPLRFFNKSRMKNHVNAVHLKKRTHVCTVCEKGFVTSGLLMHHIRATHSTGGRTRDHICNVCGKSFYTSTTLKSHVVAVHLKERPFTCQLCPATFGSSGVLFRHNKLKHKKQTRAGKKQAE